MLAKLLEEQGLSTDYEQRAGRKKIDVVAHVDGIKVALEAETGFHRKAQAIKEAAVMLPEQVVGSLWTPCRPHNSDFAKALCFYPNSTPGLLTLLGERDNKIPAYPAFSLGTLR